MTFEIEINGRTRVVAIESVGAAGSGGGRFRVTVDGDVCELSARPTDVGLSLVTEPDGRVIDASVTVRDAGECLVQLPHVALTVVVDGRRSKPAHTDTDAGPGPRRVTAPMPGRIVRILVKPGDTVAARQGLIVIEAMKMENELGAPKAGVVKEIGVAEGTSVESGRLLAVIE